MEHCFYQKKIEEVRAEMVLIFDACNNFTDQAVVKISQELDYLLNEYSGCLAKSER
ncbi:aspartyl-phosphate phosphatase Spo0E family protein [Paenibacillus sp. PL91]|uniref:aspartyl-phosphate phosphatase Spo0E family protein n=1 Tax=Paenibacillus sp. PL91 TaxID=2729538 RepID=UPI00145DCDEB|nr:aspartyl-phosphate phosphatase Spo0E family protein [Paenibacillus sp. PL91]MBC9199752.1 aspartyl-phosphate phosphatase Spo0E family protein [Paenibacillus sp. PL91]